MKNKFRYKNWTIEIKPVENKWDIKIISSSKKTYELGKFSYPGTGLDLAIAKIQSYEKNEVS
jgi:hypothetical protein